MDNKTEHLKPQAAGIICSQCGCGHFYTVYTRVRDDGIIRLKQCRYCGRRIHTKEKML